MDNSHHAFLISIKQRPLRLLLVSIVLVVGLLTLALTGGHSTHLTKAGLEMPIPAFEEHCGAVLCLTLLPTVVAALTAPMLLASMLVHVRPSFSSIHLPRLDPPPRGIA